VRRCPEAAHSDVPKRFTERLMRWRQARRRAPQNRAGVRASNALGAALCAVLFVFAAPGLARAARPHLTPLSVAVDRTHPGAPVPRNFLGLSFELSSLPQIADFAAGGDLVALLRSIGPGVLRFGGVSADFAVAWGHPGGRPAWASSVVDAEDLRGLARLAAETGWRVLLTIGLGHYEPEAAALEAASAKTILGNSLAGIELGNEPNAYAQHGLREEPWSFVQYSAQVSAYRSAIEAAAPGIALAGPDVSGSGVWDTWGLGEVIDQQPALLTGHHYPLGCAEVPAPTIERLLSPAVKLKELASLERYMSVARASETPFRVDEANTVSCGGVAGISNTFASALWAVGYSAEAMSMGVSGINFHGNLANCEGYSPLCAPTSEALAAGALGAQPEWYALLLAKALIGDRPLATVMSRPGRPNVQVTTLLASGGRLHAVVVDDDPPGARGVAVRLRVGAGFGRASVLSLTAPGPAAQTGVQLGGRAVAADGVWSEPRKLPSIPNLNGTITVDVAPSSAALLTVSAGPR
jgi:hypothetical protein